jgi:hypothetical protein
VRKEPEGMDWWRAREAETMAERGGSDRGCWESVGSDEVDGCEVDLEPRSMAMKWFDSFERKDPEPRKNWPGSRKEWLW